jgi:Peptidoglycan-binding protein, CsiV
MRWTLSAAAALLASAAVAQAPQPPAAEPALPPRYEVEILIFAHRTFDTTEERFDFAPPNGFGTDTAVLREAPVFDDTTFNAPLEPLVPAPFTPVDPVAEQRAAALRVVALRPEELKLGNEYRKLQGISAYQPLVHAGWVQPGLPETDATPFDLQTLGVLNPRGTVRVHLGTVRLHITLDLTYTAAAGATPAPGAPDGLDEFALAPQYRLTTTRSARSNELHYFDHPAFGVLVRVTPVPAQDGGRRPAA